MIPFAIGLGANLGDREGTLRRALALVDATDGVELFAASSLYRTPPWGDLDQGPFLNGAAVGRTTLAPRALLARLQRTETLLGKKVVRRWGPRAIDIDLLFIGDHVSNAPDLELPHPRIAERPFAYLPLREALAAARIPADACPAPTAEALRIEHEAERHSPVASFPAHASHADQIDIELPWLEATHALARVLALLLADGGALALDGPLGAGKSELARETLRALGVEGRIPSPTYTLCREYELPMLLIQHWDFYRMGDESELESAGFNAPRTGSALVVAEWAARFPQALPASAIRIALQPRGETSRLATISRAGGLPLLLRTFSTRAESA